MDGVNEFLREYPFLIGGAGILVGAVVGPVITHVFGHYSARRLENRIRTREKVKLQYEEAMAGYRQQVDNMETERRDLRQVFSDAIQASQAHWWSLSALARDWKEGHDPRSLSVLEHRKEFHASRRELMAAVGAVEVQTGRLAEPRQGFQATTSGLAKVLIAESEERKESGEQGILPGDGLANFGRIRVFSEDLATYIEPYLEASGGSIPNFCEKDYLALRIQQQDFNDGFLTAAVEMNEIALRAMLKKLSPQTVLEVLEEVDRSSVSS